MKSVRLAIAIALSLGTVTAASAASITGQAALALAGIVALYAPMPAANKKAVAARSRATRISPTRPRSRSRRTRSCAGPAMSTSPRAPAS